MKVYVYISEVHSLQCVIAVYGSLDTAKQRIEAMHNDLSSHRDLVWTSWRQDPDHHEYHERQAVNDDRQEIIEEHDIILAPRVESALR